MILLVVHNIGNVAISKEGQNACVYVCDVILCIVNFS